MDLWFLYTRFAPTVMAVGVVLTLVVELGLRLVRGDAVPWRELRLSAVAAAGFMAAKVVARYALFLPLYVALWPYRVVDLDVRNPLVWVGVFLVRDAVSYWVHRAEHRFGWLWASHSVHHSFETMSPSCAIRVPWMENFYKAPFGLWMPMLGFDFRLVVGIDVAAALVSIAQHTEAFPARERGWIQRWFIVPSHHRVHHGTNEFYLDRNFGAVLCVWDRLFGTFQPEVEPVRYGILGRPLRSPKDMVLGRYPDLVRDALG